MKKLACMLSLLALAFNVATGFSGSILFCEHASGDTHLVSREAHLVEAHESACHEHDPILLRDASVEECCETCTDIEVGGDDLRDLLRSSNQERIAAPPVVSVEFTSFDLAELFDSGLASLLPATRAPPAGESLTRLQVKRTVLRI